MLELRTLNSDDWPLWRELRLAALAEAPYAFGSTLAQWQGSGDREERWRARLSIPGAHDLVALLDGLPVGMASGVPGEKAETVELISMWVNPGARGGGVGDHLIQAVERWAAERGATTRGGGGGEGPPPRAPPFFWGPVSRPRGCARRLAPRAR
ncbi:GNAT family N-acetyltransferase, partial [Streptomyces sp. NPDC059717]|uniref:GNAT family N-acetyltransferase n=1 Tax=Streptomyces sp. NPDC059717 TaxID=3346922 RepID=UPI0036BB8A91